MSEKGMHEVCTHLWARSECKPISSVGTIKIDGISFCPTCLTVTIRSGEKVYHIINGILATDSEDVDSPTHWDQKHLVWLEDGIYSIDMGGDVGRYRSEKVNGEWFFSAGGSFPLVRIENPEDILSATKTI